MLFANKVIISSTFIVLYFVVEAFTKLQHLCLCLYLNSFTGALKVLQALDLSALHIIYW